MFLNLAVVAFLATVTGLPISVLKNALRDFNLEAFDGVLTYADQQKLQELVQTNLEIRRTRLRNLLKTVTNKTLEAEIEIKQLLENLKTENSSRERVGIFEINDAAGVAEYLFEGDIDLTEQQLVQLEATSTSRQKRQVSTFAPKWPNKTVYYYFAPELNSKAIEATNLALNYLRSHTCIKFVQNPKAKNRVKVFPGDGCYTTLGMAGGEQELSLGIDCETVGTAAHEFMHTLGLYHTHQRPDRDNYISINTAVIEDKYISNFNQFPNKSSIYVPYGYGSVMHYDATAGAPWGYFSIISKDPRYTYTMGSQQVSFSDLKVINEHYKCNALCPPNKSAKCKNGGVPNPRNCSICNCPSGYGGNLCGRTPDGCGENLTAKSEWNTTYITVGDGTTHPDYHYCNHWITAPPGHKVQFKITYISNEKCEYGCTSNGIEVKIQNQTETGFRYCCSSYVKPDYFMISELNPTPIITYNKYKQSTFAVDYRATDGTPPPTTPPPCVDKNSICTRWAHTGQCKRPALQEFIDENCRKSCRLCK